MGVVDHAGAAPRAGRFNPAQQGKGLFGGGGLRPICVEHDPEIRIGCVKLGAVAPQHPRARVIPAGIDDGKTVLIGKDAGHLRRKGRNVGVVGTFCRGNEGHTCICQFLFPFPRAKVGVDDIKIGKGHLCGFCRRKSEVDGKLGFAAAVVTCDDGDPPGKQHPLPSFPKNLLV